MNRPPALDLAATTSPQEPRPLQRGWQYRLGIVSRVLAAACGGYVLATVASVGLSRLCGLNPAEAVMTGLLVSFPIYAAAILWCFATRSAGRAWAGLVIVALVTGAIGWAIGPGSTP
jgi:hypothetical protein